MKCAFERVEKIKTSSNKGESVVIERIWTGLNDAKCGLR